VQFHSPSHALRRVISGTIVAGVCLWAGVSGPTHAAASPVTYYFHGNAGSDDPGRGTGTPTATFDTIAATGTTDSTQSAIVGPNAVAGPTDQLYPYWIGTAVPAGAISGTMHLATYWSSTNAEAVALGMAVDIQVFTNVTVAAAGGTGTLIGSTDPNSPPTFAVNATPTLNTVDITLSGTVVNNFVIQMAPHFIDTGQGNTVHYNTTSAPSSFTLGFVVPPPPSPGLATSGSQKFANFTSPQPNPHMPPPTVGVSFLFGEPSLGVDWVTNNTMYQGDLNTWQIQFTYANQQTPTANWLDRSDPAVTSTASLDARLITDHTGGARGTDDRTLVDQLLAGQSSQAFSDTNGGTTTPNGNAADWTPEVGGGFPSGPDHESTGAGRYHAGTPGLPTPAYPHAVYYCAQASLTAFCARSDDGGLNFGAGISIFTSTQCGALHGKPRVGPDGTVYVPNKDCSASGGASAAKGVIVSQDNGVSWTVHNIPNTSTDSNQSDSDVAVGGDTGMGTVYYGYRDGDHHAKVAVSTNDGNTWSTPFDIGAPFGIQNAQFPAVIAGDQNRASVSFIGTPAPGSDLPDNMMDPNTGQLAVWHLYTAFTYDGGTTWQTVDDTPTLPVQRGGVCMQGTGCSGNDRNLLDFNDSNIDNQGRVQVAYTDGCTGACETSPSAPVCTEGTSTCTGIDSSIFSMVDQVCGLGLFAKFDPGFNNDPACPALSPTIPESPIVAPLVGAGFVAVTIAFIFGRRRRGRSVEIS
jgi:hypothetical protein